MRLAASRQRSLQLVSDHHAEQGVQLFCEQAITELLAEEAAQLNARPERTPESLPYVSATEFFPTPPKED